jgi:hypothetical protein
MRKDFFKRWYASDDSGRQLFYIQVFGYCHSEFYFIESSLPDTVIIRAEYLPIINSLCKPDLEITERDRIVQSFIDIIKQVPKVEQYYFPNSVLNRNGLYCESYVRTLEEIIANPTIKERVPYSIHCNKIIFDELATAFSKEEEHSEIPIERNDFEQLLNGNNHLQNAYLDVFNLNAKYFYGYEVIELLHLECYYMTVEDKIVFIFFTEISES